MSAAAGPGPPEKEVGPDVANAEANQQSRNTTESHHTARNRSALRACHMITAASGRDYRRFVRLYRDAQQAGPQDMRWTMLHLTWAAAHYMDTDDHLTVAFHGITAADFGGDE